MNEIVEKRLNLIKAMTEEIQSMCECALDDCDDVTESSDLFIIESQMDRIIRKADYARETVRNTYDEFDEEEN